MRERPILFSAPMVRAILEGRKTQTRRALKSAAWPYVDKMIETNPYGQPGDRLWVREAWNWCYAAAKDASGKGAEDRELIDYAADGHPSVFGFKWRPSIHMPRWASCILLEVTAVRVERLQDIAPPDCAAEGIFSSDIVMTDELYLHGYRSLWESINGPGSWAANPWVWVVEFKKVSPGETAGVAP